MQDKIPCPMCGAPLEYFGEALMCSYTCRKCDFRTSCVLEDNTAFSKFKAILQPQPAPPMNVFVQMNQALDMVKEGAQFTILSGLGSEADSSGRLIMLAVYRALDAAAPHLPKPKPEAKSK